MSLNLYGIVETATVVKFSATYGVEFDTRCSLFWKFDMRYMDIEFWYVVFKKNVRNIPGDRQIANLAKWRSPKKNQV